MKYTPSGLLVLNIDRHSVNPAFMNGGVNTKPLLRHATLRHPLTGEVSEQWIRPTKLVSYSKFVAETYTKQET